VSEVMKDHTIKAYQEMLLLWKYQKLD